MLRPHVSICKVSGIIDLHHQACWIFIKQFKCFAQCDSTHDYKWNDVLYIILCFVLFRHCIYSLSPVIGIHGSDINTCHECDSLGKSAKLLFSYLLTFKNNFSSSAFKLWPKKHGGKFYCAVVLFHLLKDNFIEVWEKNNRASWKKIYARRRKL